MKQDYLESDSILFGIIIIKHLSLGYMISDIKLGKKITHPWPADCLCSKE
jgi:hypothetical protein